MREVWNGVSVPCWSRKQTLNPMPEGYPNVNLFVGYSPLRVEWWELGVPAIPLEIRFNDFKRRLAEALKRNQKEAAR